MRDRTLPHRVRDALRYRLFRQTWTIAVARCPIEELAGLRGQTLQRQALESLDWMPEHRGTFRADPFPLPGRDDEHIRIVFEELRWDQDRGTIGICEYDGQAFGPPEPVLALSHHLSYPFTLKCSDQWLMIPEQAEALVVKSYDAGNCFESSATLLSELALVDSTVVEHDGSWWLFASHAGKHENSQLHLYRSQDLYGPWAAHPANPVKSDIGSARPAGQLFHHQGSLYRPGQNCTDHYGQSIKVHRVLRLDETSYEEEQVAEIAPLPGSRYPDGLHTISALGPYSVIDGARLESRLHPALDWLSGLVK